MLEARLRYKIFEVSYETTFRNPGGKEEFRSSDNLFSLIWQQENQHQTTHFQGTLHWISKERPSVGLTILDLQISLQPPSLDGLRVFQQGYQSWGFSTSYSAHDRDESPLLDFLRYNEENIYTTHSGKTGHFTSEALVVLYNEVSEQGFLAGVSGRARQYTKFITEFESSSGRIQNFSVIFDFYCSPPFRGNKGIPLAPILTKSFTNSFPEQELEEYGQLLAKQHNLAETPTEIPIGWCSWYYYYTKISEEVLLSNLARLSEQNLAMDLFQIDDGYQAEIGDWLILNDNFPNGLKPIVDKILAHGLRPGLWLAPFLIRKNSEFYIHNPEAVLRDEKGNPVPALWNPLWGWDYTYALDASHPKTREYLEHVFKTLTKDWGFSYLKLDFLYAASLIGIPYNRSETPLERYRNAVEFLRNVVGKDVFLLGCGAPLVPSIGVFDGMRIGCDVTPFWGVEWSRKLLRDKHALCTEKALVNTMTRTFMHKNLWLNDPDCLLVRKDKNQMSYEQTLMMASIMAMSGGMLLVSDNMNTIQVDRLEILHKAITLSKICSGQKSLPLGVMQSQFPKAFWNPQGLLGVWNPQSKSAKITISLPKIDENLMEWTEYWQGKTFADYSPTIQDDSISLQLTGFASAVFYDPMRVKF